MRVFSGKRAAVVRTTMCSRDTTVYVPKNYDHNIENTNIECKLRGPQKDETLDPNCLLLTVTLITGTDRPPEEFSPTI